MPPALTANEKARAISRYARVAPNKARQVVLHIRGLPVPAARRVLALSPKDVSVQILKTLDSAVANAGNNADPPYDADELIVSSAVIDEGPMLKRFQPRAMGRAYRVRKRTSHITIAVGTPPGAPVTRAEAERERGRRFGRRRSGAEGASSTTTTTSADAAQE